MTNIEAYKIIIQEEYNSNPTRFTEALRVAVDLLRKEVTQEIDTPKSEKMLRDEVLASVVSEVEASLSEAGYTYDDGMSIGDNIGSALLGEFARGVNTGITLT